MIERAVAIANGPVLLEHHLPIEIQSGPAQPSSHPEEDVPTLEEQERQYILWVLEHKADGNQTKAAQILGIDRVSLWRKLKRYQEAGLT